MSDAQTDLRTDPPATMRIGVEPTDPHSEATAAEVAAALAEKAKLPTDDVEGRRARRGWFERWRSERPRYARQAQRFECKVLCELYLETKQYVVQGALVDISANGALFRPMSMFLLKLQNEPVVLKTTETEMRALVRNTTAQGYGVQFSKPLADAQIMEILAEEELYENA